MSSRNSTIIVDIGSSNSFTTSVDTSPLGMHHTLNSLLSSNVTRAERMVASIPQENIIQIHEDLANLKI